MSLLINMRPIARAIANWLNKPDFFAPLTTSLVTSVGAATPTFTRATTAIIEDFEGIVRPAKAGEARFWGARRVENLMSYSEDITNAFWTAVLATKTDAQTVTFTSAGNGGALLGAKTGLAAILGRRFVMRAELKVPSGSGTATLRITNADGTFEAFLKQVNLTTSWQTFSLGGVFATSTGTGVRAQITSQVGDTAQVVNIRKIQLEEVTGQSNQNPSEYVSANVLSAPFHGAGADGIKYFSTLNGNTVSGDGVVTEATGAAIPATTLKGYLSETAATNLAVWSADLTNASWTKAGTTATLDGIAPLASEKWSKLTESATAGIHYAYQPRTVTQSAVYTTTVRLKADGRRYARVSHVSSGSATAVYVDVDLITGTIVNASAYGAGSVYTHSSIKALSGGGYEVTLTGSLLSTSTFNVITLRNSASNVQTEAEQNYTGDGVSAIQVWGMQFEQSTRGTTYIPTTAAAVARNADNLTYPIAGLYSDTQGTLYAEATPRFDIPASSTAGFGWNFIADFGTSVGRVSSFSNFVERNDGTNSIQSPAWVPLRGTTYKVGSRWGSAGQRNWVNGTAGTNGAFDGSINGSGTFSVGRAAFGTNQMNGSIKNLKFWKRALSDADITKVTT